MAVRRTMDLQLSGRTALVTGASMGIGRGIALALAREGVTLAVVARRRALLDALEREAGVGMHVIECDLLREDAAQRVAEAALGALGSVEILVNNAGGSRRFSLQASEAQ